MQVSADGKASLLAWYFDNQNYVELTMMEKKDKWLLKQRSGGNQVARDSLKETIEPNVTYHVLITFNGSNFQVFIDDSVIPILDVPAGAIPNGGLAVRVKSAKESVVEAKFDEFLVY